MATEIRIPKLGMGMVEGKIVEWLVADGAAVKTGDILYSLETEKSVSEIEAPASGILRIAAAADEIYEIGTLIGKIE